ncbi:hypothetical protein R3F64_18310 [Halomonas sp. 5021]|uniref:hypothetical protein n=1 Tax=Halomonas sp. 5021 TaxID=3082156 RepID=UPI002FC60E19
MFSPKRPNLLINLDLVEWVPGGLERYRPNLEYLLLDEGAIVNDPEWSDRMRNVAASSICGMDTPSTAA